MCEYTCVCSCNWIPSLPPYIFLLPPSSCLFHSQHLHCTIPHSPSLTELTVLYGSLFLSPHSSFDRTLLSRVLLTLISLSSTQCDIDTAALFDFFSQAMPKIE